MQQLATRLNIPFIILDFPLSKKELFRRVELRSKQAGQVSEATSEVLKNQLGQAQPMTISEEQNIIKVHPDSSPETIATLINSRSSNHYQSKTGFSFNLQG